MTTEKGVLSKADKEPVFRGPSVCFIYFGVPYLDPPQFLFTSITTTHPPLFNTTDIDTTRVFSLVCQFFFCFKVVASRENNQQHHVLWPVHNFTSHVTSYGNHELSTNRSGQIYLEDHCWSNHWQQRDRTRTTVRCL